MRILPHELAFAALYAIVIVRLAAAPNGPAWSEIAIWCVFAATSGLAVAWSSATESTLAWRIRLGAYLVLMNAAYSRMGAVHETIGTPMYDGALQAADRALFGQPLPLYFDRWVSPAASQLLSACYFLLFPYIVIGCARQLWRFERSPDEARRFFSGMFTVYGIGLLGYLLLPAAGPYIAMPDAFTRSISGGWMTALNDAAIRRGSNHVDVFPSLHIAVSAFFLGFDRRYARWRFHMYAVPATALWVSTLYLRYHYGIDVLCGFALAGLGLCVAFRDADTRQETAS
ncbi:MAG TPA: phosphatase PAP2 family protein [Gemmatimonadaceae bacterium]|jgi:hypothetical protein|nr:phosphatase PAP2 family protein [Gemmatimonadaceae bacterium]